jgi:hypothetical protein
MGLYDFKAQFVDKILAGEKTHTIRAVRSHPDKPGNTLHLYTGLRHKGARLLMRATCTKVEAIRIGPLGIILIDGVMLEQDEREQLARRDGFKDFIEMLYFWKDRLPFQGHIIHWRYPSCD